MTVELPTVTVVVPAYNAESTIAECIHSLLVLDYPQDQRELIVVDNASTDATAQVLEQLGGRIVALTESKRGPSAARNRGVRAATGEVVAFTDSDCVVDRDWLRRIMPRLTDETVGVVGGRILARHPHNEIEAYGEQIHSQDKAINGSIPPYVISMNWASRRSLFRHVGLFDEALNRGQDVDLSWRILRHGYRLVYEPSAVVYHRNENSLQGLFQEGLTHGFHAPRIHKKHWDLLAPLERRRWYGGSGRAAVRGLLDYLGGRDRPASVFRAAFNSGKQIGMLAGSIRWGYPEL
ncbi:MAG: glycosyltransferase [Anaerolineae bacterium]|jgi:cellulose synthase/poly-beta-1,6-N-acetylglucosamine synthase-like glycosyltransferase